jgi:hypothetical protein
LTVKEKFACAFIANPEPTRLRALQALEKYGEVDVFGPYSGITASSKYEIARDYKYTICFENDLFPGYITEKLLDAYVCGTVPLYWGHFGKEAHINRECLVNAADFDSIEDFAYYVSTISPSKYEAIYKTPLLNSLPSSENLMRALVGVR